MKTNTQRSSPSHTAIFNTDKSFSTLRPEGAVGCNVTAELKLHEYIRLSATQPTSAVLYTCSEYCTIKIVRVIYGHRYVHSVK
jgi:hypothetical protein